jgi:hypothetical protein
MLTCVMNALKLWNLGGQTLRALTSAEMDKILAMVA